MREDEEEPAWERTLAREVTMVPSGQVVRAHIHYREDLASTLWDGAPTQVLSRKHNLLKSITLAAGFTLDCGKSTVETPTLDMKLTRHGQQLTVARPVTGGKGSNCYHRTFSLRKIPLYVSNK